LGYDPQALLNSTSYVIARLVSALDNCPFSSTILQSRLPASRYFFLSPICTDRIIDPYIASKTLELQLHAQRLRSFLMVVRILSAHTEKKSKAITLFHTLFPPYNIRAPLLPAVLHTPYYCPDAMISFINVCLNSRVHLLSAYVCTCLSRQPLRALFLSGPPDVRYPND